MVAARNLVSSNEKIKFCTSADDEDAGDVVCGLVLESAGGANQSLYQKHLRTRAVDRSAAMARRNAGMRNKGVSP